MNNAFFYIEKQNKAEKEAGHMRNTQGLPEGALPTIYDEVDHLENLGNKINNKLKIHSSKLQLSWMYEAWVQIPPYGKRFLKNIQRILSK